MGRPGRRGPKGPQLNPNAWMATMSDLVFLLITFFVLLISMSSLDAKKLQDAFGFFDDAIDVLKYPQNASGSDRSMEIINPLATLTSRTLGKKEEGEKGDPDLTAREAIAELSKSMRGEKTPRAAAGLLSPLVERVSGSMSVERLEDGFSLTLPERLVFERGGFEIGAEGSEILSDVATMARGWGGRIRIEGSWPWHEGPIALAAIADLLERRWISGDLLLPVLTPGNNRTVRFVFNEG